MSDSSSASGSRLDVTATSAPAPRASPPEPDEAAVRTAVESVPDPELPPVTVGNLGMLHDLEVRDDGRVRVELLPTFSGCPAIDVIAEDVTEAAGQVAGVTHVDVRFRFDPPWTPARIDEDGRERLREFGITPPSGPVRRSPALDDLEARRMLPLASATEGGTRPCPYCGSDDTVADSPFGPTPCRSIHYCNACRQPFEAFKDL